MIFRSIILFCFFTTYGCTQEVTFTKLPNDVADKYILKLNSYLNNTIQDWNMEYYSGLPEHVNSFCSDGEETAFGCMFSPNKLVISINYIDSCVYWAHELLHVYLYRRTGYTDFEHKNELFNEVNDICYGSEE